MYDSGAAEKYPRVVQDLSQARIEVCSQSDSWVLCSFGGCSRHQTTKPVLFLPFDEVELMSSADLFLLPVPGVLSPDFCCSTIRLLTSNPTASLNDKEWP